MKRIILPILAVCLFLSGCCLSHEWEEATCASPRICTNCQKTEGEALPHTWQDATCTNPKTCTVCGAAEGETLPHVPGEWIVTRHPYKGNDGFREQRCIDCDAVLEQEAYTLNSIHDGKVFTITHQEFRDRMNSILQEISPNYTCELHEKYDGEELFLVVKCNGHEKAVIMDISDTVPLTELMFLANEETKDVFVDDDTFAMAPAFLMACDPRMKEKTANFFIQELKKLKYYGLISLETKEYNDLYYWFFYIQGEKDVKTSLQLEVSPQALYSGE